MSAAKQPTSAVQRTPTPAAVPLQTFAVGPVQSAVVPALLTTPQQSQVLTPMETSELDTQKYLSQLPHTDLVSRHLSDTTTPSLTKESTGVRVLKNIVDSLTTLPPASAPPLPTIPIAPVTLQFPLPAPTSVTLVTPPVATPTRQKRSADEEAENPAKAKKPRGFSNVTRPGGKNQKKKEQGLPPVALEISRHDERQLEVGYGKPIIQKSIKEGAKKVKRCNWNTFYVKR